MNRPFHAFGGLLVFLALAMFAVSSSQRSTTLGPKPAATKIISRLPRPRGGGMYVMSIPGGPDCETIGTCGFVAASTLPSAFISEEMGELELCNDVPTSLTRRELLQPIGIQPVRDVMAEVRGQEPDCLAHHDPLYDFVVNGVQSIRPSVLPSATTALGRVRLGDEELVAVFLAVSGKTSGPALRSLELAGH